MDYGAIVKLFATSYSGILRNETFDLIKTLQKCENEILSHDPVYNPFFDQLIASSTESIVDKYSSISQSKLLPQVLEATKLIIRYILDRYENNLNSNLLLTSLKSICDGKASYDNVSNTSLKYLKYPESTKPGGTGTEDDSAKYEMKRSRSDLSIVIMQQLTQPLMEGIISFTTLSEDEIDCTDLIRTESLEYLKSLNAGDILLKWAVSIPTITANSNLKYENDCFILQTKNLHLPTTHSEAQSIKQNFKQMDIDITNILNILQLPVIEPLSLTKIKQLTQLSLSSLYCCILTSITNSILMMSSSSSTQIAQTKTPSNTSVSSSSGKDGTAAEDNQDDISRNIVDKSLEIFRIVGEILKRSTKNYIYQNHVCLGAWLLISGIQGAMSASGGSQKSSTNLQVTEDAQSKTKSPAKVQEQPRVNLFKVQQSFGVLNAAISRHSIQLLEELLDDLKVELLGQETDEAFQSTLPPELQNFSVLKHYTGLERIICVFSGATLQQLLTFLATISYRKACNLRRLNTKNLSELGGETLSYSDSTTYFNDTLSGSDESDTESSEEAADDDNDDDEEEEDSESYLGSWLKETLSPEASDDIAEPNEPKEEKKTPTNLVPAKDEPHEYLELSAQILIFLDQKLGDHKIKFLARYVKNGLSEQQMVLLANILKDLDRDSLLGFNVPTAENQSQNDAVNSEIQWQKTMVKFSSAIGKYMHNLISNQLLSENLQSLLLQNLGVSPWQTESNSWPLQVYSRSLAVLVQILMLKPPQEKEAACLSVWHRLVNTLVEEVCSTNIPPEDYEDLNVEHAQLLLFLFHSLNLMQKKYILLLTAGGVIRCAEVCRNICPERPLRDNQLMLLSRLLLFLEYLMKHLYSAPNILLEQVRWNLFGIFTIDSEQKISNDMSNYKEKMAHFYRKEIEDKYRKSCTAETQTIKPKFYSLTVINSAKQEFKMDGLAWNFILCTPNKLKYPLLIDSLINVLNITDMSVGKVSFQTQCAVQYCFSLAWKLLLGLPPSTQHVENLMALEDKQVNLHTLLWSVRCLKPITHSHSLIVNSLIKQGIYTQTAETMWDTLTDKLSDFNHILTLSNYGLESFLTSFQSQQMRLSKVVLLDGILSHLYAILWADKEGINLKQKPAQTSSASSSPNDIKIQSDENDATAETSATTSSLAADENLCRELMENLVKIMEILTEVTFKTMSQALSGQIPIKLIEPLAAIGNTKNSLCRELSQKILELLQSNDKEVLNGDWNKQLSVVGENNFQANTFPVETHTINVIDSHITEISKHSTYSILLSLKHTLTSLINLIYLMLPNYDDEKIDQKLKALLVPLLFDIRSEYLHELINKCLESLIGGDLNSETYQMLAFKHILQSSYTLILEYCEMSAVQPNGTPKSTNMDEAMILEIIVEYLHSLLDKSIGVKALREFFFETKQGNLVNILLSFSGTSLSQEYSRKVLKFFKKLFQTSENTDSPYPIEEVCESLADLGNVDCQKLKNWLSHILLGPTLFKPLDSSASSSNIPTPTNLGTQSQATTSGPSLPNDKKSTVDPDAMEIDEECSKVLNSNSISVLWQPTATVVSETQPNGESNGKLLQILTKYLFQENRLAPNVSQTMFQALIQLGNGLLSCGNVSDSALLDFTDLLQVMITLADAEQGKGHTMLFTSVVEWLDTCKNQVMEKYQKVGAQTTSKVQLENVSSILKYMSDLLNVLNGPLRTLAGSGTWEDDIPFDIEDFILDETLGGTGADDEDSAIDDSDEDSLSGKLCTFSVTQKEFMNQHWYWCYDCKMVDGVGVCSVCARVCHKGHDISYAKYGNFFCDCGAKEDNSCLAMTKRVPGAGQQDHSILDNNTSIMPAATAIDSDQLLISSLKRRNSGAHIHSDFINNLINSKQTLTKILEESRESLINQDSWKNVLKIILNFFNNLMPMIKENCAKYSTVGCHLRAKNALERLHQPDKSVQFNDQIMVATLGSQEGAFENVRMNYSGDQGQAIRQLLSTNLIRRVALCCLASPHGKRQHLAVSHEKGKVTILQLSALLKQADAAKKKLTLTRLSSVPIPCTVLSLSANPANEDFLAVCGLKECHVLTFSPNGTAQEHIALTPQLEIGNFLKRAIWLPGSQTKLALVTADFVKIYDLAEDSLNPKYYFLVPSGKIRDCTFVLQESTYYMLIMSSMGYIYTQPLTDESLATLGPFYVTNTLELDHPFIKDLNGQILNGGVSIYYSHALKMLFFSYSMGRSFMAPLEDVNKGVKCVISLSTNAGNKIISKSNSQPLCQWTEILGHPGLVCAMMQNSNNPVIFMLKPDGYIVQEIKATNTKAKIMDMVAIRHSVSGVEKTTLILLCEDGSLRIFAANPEVTNYWLSPKIQPIGNYYNSGIGLNKESNKKKTKKNVGAKQQGSGKSQQLNSSSSSSNTPTFPVDFFEHCSVMTEVEYGGNDLLQVYNVQQLKNRLNNTGYYVASQKPNGFTLEVINNDPNMVITGIRVQVGTQESNRAPSNVMIYGRTIETATTRPRWFDIPLTREESLQSDKRFSVIFGPSGDPDNVTMIDSIKVYGKTKEAFGWPCDTDDVAGSPSSAPTTVPANAQPGGSDSDSGLYTISPLDKMTTTMLHVMDNCLYLLGGHMVDHQLKQQSIDVATALILLPTPGVVQQFARSVLATLHSTKSQYHLYKDKEILNDVNNELKLMLNVNDFKNIDPESFYRLVLMLRNIAVQRPQQFAKICQEQQYPIITSLMKLIKELHCVSQNYEEANTIIHYGLSHKETIIHVLIEIIYAFIYTDISQIEQMAKYFVELLLDTDSQIAHSAKQAIIRLLRPKFKRNRKVLIESNTPPSCLTPTPMSTGNVAAPASDLSQQSSGIQEVDAIEPLRIESNEGAGNGNVSSAMQSIEALLGISGLAPNVEMNQEVEEETLMELAIALSLLDNDTDLQTLQNLVSLQGRLRGNQALQAIASAAGIDLNASNNQEEDNYSASGNQDRSSVSRLNTSVGGSDDEENVSNVATDGGSTLRTSPTAEQIAFNVDNAIETGSGGSAHGSESGGSIGGTSGRSSTYEEPVANQSPPKASTSGLQQIKQQEIEEISDQENSSKLHVIRYTILEKMIDNFDALDQVNGCQAIPFMQVILMLTSDLEGNQDTNRNILNKLLNAVTEKLEVNMPSGTQSQSGISNPLAGRTPKAEVQLILLRFVVILMGKVKSSSISKSSSSVGGGINQTPNNLTAAMLYNIQFVATSTANALMRSGGIAYCLSLLENYLNYWKNSNGTENAATNGITPIITTSDGTPTKNTLLKPTQYGTIPDMQPFFARQYVKGLNDVFEMYVLVLTEMVVRLPYQILKLSSQSSTQQQQQQYDSTHLTFILCEYMMYMQSPMLRRQIRKLLLYICGNKERYRQLRDLHSLNTHMKAVKNCCMEAGRIQVGTPTTSVGNQAISLIGSSTSAVLSYNSLVSLIEHLRACYDIASVRTGNWQRFCFLHTDTLSSLLSISCNQLDESISSIILQLLQAAVVSIAPPLPEKQKERASREKSEEGEPGESKFDPANCKILVQQIFNQVPVQNLTLFIKTFLLEMNTTSIRWYAHGLINACYENSNEANKKKLLQCLWGLWPLLPAYGKRTVQFVDLIGYLTLNTKSIVDKLPEYTAQAVQVLRQQNELLAKHPNAPLYSALGQVLEIDGYFLESEPCLVCNTPEVPMTNIKLSSIKVDSKFTTTTTIVKLVQSHTISKVILRIGDLKRAKMVRTINVYYNNRSVHAVVELKNRPSMWHKARTVTLQSGQTDIKIDFSLPITACNLMIEYEDFYETVTSSSENLQCPRCSAAVPADPGVCSNCGENVFQCHKCRAINYDEKDPFLCHSCGFCKYAKFDYSIYGRPCCAVDPIESAEDRTKTVQAINGLAEKADRSYRVLQTNKQILELLVQNITEHKLDRTVDETISGSITGSSHVNKVIQLLSQKYCVESKTQFEELCKIVQKVQACRRELITYDRSQMDLPTTATPIQDFHPDIAIKPVMNNCYSCALASTEQCLALLRAMCSQMQCRQGLCNEGLVRELAMNNLRRGTYKIQEEVRQLLCLLTRDLPEPTEELCTLLYERIKTSLNGTVPLASLDTAVRHEMSLFEALLAQEDNLCWEIKFKPVLQLFLIACNDRRGPAMAVILPCLRIIQMLICPQIPTSKLNKDKNIYELSSIKPSEGLDLNHRKWLASDKSHNFESWKKRQIWTPPSAVDQERKETLKITKETSTKKPTFGSVMDEKRRAIRNAYLFEKYGKRWRQKVLQKDVKQQSLDLRAAWLLPIMFNPNSRLGRQLCCAIVNSCTRSVERKRNVLNLLTSFLKYVGDAGEASAEFLTLYRSMANEAPWRQYLCHKQKVLTEIANLLTVEIEKIHRLEETTLSSDLGQGYALKQFVDLISMFLENQQIRQTYKGTLLQPIIQGYLNLKKLVVQRTRLIDEAQEKLLEMLEELTTGTEEDTAAFITICIDTIKKTPPNDYKTPIFMLERLCVKIHNEGNDIGEFFLTLEKDQQQEDFLQGRMLGNPYPSSELGPLMRDIKNKICLDCELVALLEDDNGMELLVNNKIISLDLPVKEVYKKVWLSEGGERDAMRIIYRIRGLLGDATEEFIESLSAKTEEEVDNEQLYRMANVIAERDGLKVILERLSYLQNVSKTKPLLQVLLKLFLLCVKVKKCREVLCEPDLGAINIFLKVLQLCLQTDNDRQIATITEQLLEIMETILSKAASGTLDSFLQFSLTFGGPEYIQALLSCTNYSNVRNNPSVLRHLIRVLAALVYGNDIKMALLCDHFKDIFDFEKFDMERTPEEEFKMELFCVLTTGIEHNTIGGILKDYIMGLGIIDRALNYILKNSPNVTLMRTDMDEMKEFVSKPSLKYILRFLTGLATKHEKTALAIAKDIIPIIHRLEQVSSDEHVGSLAEIFLEALCTEPTTAKRVQEVRDFTRAEKKRLAMATREKHLSAMGMKTNEKGQVTAQGSILSQMEKLREETGLSCFICREGYACQPNKVIGIYTFTKRCNVEEFELKSRKTNGYTTVTHFNVVHIDCHMSAIRLSRGRDEWESASLQNANTKCNGLLPLWGPDVSEASFSSCMARHNSYMQDSTQRLEINFSSAIHDFKLLLLRFAQEKTFHDDCGGGGPQSNMYLVPYLLFYALYISLSSRSYAREEKNLIAFLNQAMSEKWIECAYDAEGPVYQLVISIALHTPEMWQNNKIKYLKRLLVAAQVRHLNVGLLIKALKKESDREVKEYAVYKWYLMLFGLVDLIYKNHFAKVQNPNNEDWPISLFDFIRKNDEALLKSGDAVLETFRDEYLPCTSFSEFCDVAGLLSEIENPDAFMSELMQSLPFVPANDGSVASGGSA